MVIYGSITLALTSVDMIPLCASPVKLLLPWPFALVDRLRCPAIVLLQFECSPAWNVLSVAPLTSTFIVPIPSRSLYHKIAGTPTK